MVGEQLAYRILSSMIFDRTALGGAPVYYSNISNGKMTDAEAEQVELAARDLRGVPLLIEQEAGLSMAQIGARIRRAKQHFAAEQIELGLVVVDHLGLVRASDRYSGNRTNEMGEISATCKALAKELGVHLMGLSQFNRGVEGRESKRPALSDLRESGNLEQDADLVIGAFREAYYLQNSSDPDNLARLLSVKRKLELLVLKQRQGPVGPVSLFADMGANAIRNLDWC
jgi:replicative DNA helicase